MCRRALAVAVCVIVAGCSAMGPRDQLKQIGEYTDGRFLPVEHKDFPGGRVDLVNATVAGSQLLTDVYWNDEGVQTFVRVHGLPDAIAVDRRGVILLAYGDKGIAYEFNGQPRPIGQRQLNDAELDQVVTDRRLAKQAERLRQLLDQQARVQRVGRRVVKTLPASAASAAPGQYYGFLSLPVTPTVAYMFGETPDAEGRVVAWVDPDGPSAGVLQVGDRITEINGVQVAVREQSDMKLSGTVTVALVRQGTPQKLTLAPELWPFQVTFFVIPVEQPNAMAVEGAVAVTSGMLELLPEDDGLAFAVGHEVGHITKGHVERRVTAGSILKGVVRLGVVLPVAIAVPGSGQYLEAAMQGVENRFNRDQERDADRLGMRYANAAGYDPQAAVAFMDLMQEKVPVGDLAQFLDIHPPYPERRQLLQAELVGLETPSRRIRRGSRAGR